MDNISYFFSDSVHDAESQDENLIVKKALVLIEGTHTDSAKKVHNFSKSRINEIVANTNAFLEEGGRIPWQKDHIKNQDSNIGDLEGMVQARTIRKEDLPNPKLKHLIGKVGIFADRLVGKGKLVVQDIIGGKIKTLSPGIDIIRNTIIEISATPTPAILGPSTFKRYDDMDNGNFALTFEEAEADEECREGAKDEYKELCDMLWDITESIASASEEQLKGKDPAQLKDDAIKEFATRLLEILGMNDNEEEQVSNVPMSPVQEYLKKQSTKKISNMSRYYNQGEQPIQASFSLGDVAEEYGVANFGLRERFSRKKKDTATSNGIVGRTTGGRLARAAGAAGSIGLGALAFKNRKALGSTLKNLPGNVRNTASALKGKYARRGADGSQYAGKMVGPMPASSVNVPGTSARGAGRNRSSQRMKRNSTTMTGRPI